MPPTTVSRTTTALLHGLKDPRNDAAWRELVDRCGPIMRAVAFRMGLEERDVDDLVQTALVNFVEAWRRGQYDRGRGRLSTFLVTILKSRVGEWRRLNGRRAANAPTARLESGSNAPTTPEIDEVDRLWADERQRQILARALEQLRADGVDERSVTAFELYAIRGSDADAVAANLGLRREDVYGAKYRLTRRLQSIVARLDELYEDL